VDEKTLRDLIERSKRWKARAQFGTGGGITAGEAQKVREALEYALITQTHLRESSNEAVLLQADNDRLRAQLEQLQEQQVILPIAPMDDKTPIDDPSVPTIEITATGAKFRPARMKAEPAQTTVISGDPTVELELHKSPLVEPRAVPAPKTRARRK